MISLEMIIDPDIFFSNLGDCLGGLSMRQCPKLCGDLKRMNNFVD